MGSLLQMSRLNWLRTCASSSVIPFNYSHPLHSLATSFLGLPISLLPWTSISIACLPTWSSSLLSRCLYLLSPFPHFLWYFYYLFYPLMYSFLILSSLVTPHIHFNILISATSILFSSVLFIHTASVPHNMAGLITVVWKFPFSLRGTFMSQRTPEADLQLFHPACTQCFTSSSMFPLSSTMDPKYLNFCTLFSSSPSILLFSPSLLVYIYSILDLLILIPLSSNAVLHLSKFISGITRSTICIYCFLSKRKLYETGPVPQKWVFSVFL